MADWRFPESLIRWVFVFDLLAICDDATTDRIHIYADLGLGGQPPQWCICIEHDVLATTQPKHYGIVRQGLCPRWDLEHARSMLHPQFCHQSDRTESEDQFNPARLGRGQFNLEASIFGTSFRRHL